MKSVCMTSVMHQVKFLEDRFIDFVHLMQH